MPGGKQHPVGAAAVVPLGPNEALDCRASGELIRCPFDPLIGIPRPPGGEPIIGIPRPPVAPVIVPLLEGDALACFGGEDANPVKDLIDWITGRPPDPGTWPPGPGSAG